MGAYFHGVLINAYNIMLSQNNTTDSQYIDRTMNGFVQYNTEVLKCKREEICESAHNTAMLL